jgi:hypothetical protein
MDLSAWMFVTQAGCALLLAVIALTAGGES